MKNAMILHGTACKPDAFWYPRIKEFLVKQGYNVWLSSLPNPENPELKIQLPFVLKNGIFDKDTVLIGHSAGCALILSVLENIDIRIDKAILVAGYARLLGTEKKPQTLLQSSYNWKKIKENVKNIYLINSDDDPWGCNDKEGRYMFDNLGGTQVIVHGQGHFGSDKFNQPYKEFPLLEKLLK